MRAGLFLATCDALFGISFNFHLLRTLYVSSYDAETSRFFSTRNFGSKNGGRRGRTLIASKRRMPHRQLMPSQSGSSRLRALEKQNCTC